MPGDRVLSEQVVAAEPLGTAGASGNVIETVTLDDGQVLIRKRVSAEWDWISRATGDTGRALAMWEAGLFARVPASVDHATVAVEPDGPDGWAVFMRDVSDQLVDPEASLGREDLRRVLHALHDLHLAFVGVDLPALCPLELRYNLLSPITASREAARGEAVGGVIERCWEAFVDLVPGDVADVVVGLATDPRPLARRLREFTQTLVHGDVRLTNLGLAPEGIVLVDWGERSGPAPAAVELASFLMFDAPRLGAPPDEVLAEFRSISAGDHDEAALQVALIGGMVQLGPNPVLDYVLHGGEDERARAVERLQWWIGATRRALETWSP